MRDFLKKMLFTSTRNALLMRGRGDEARDERDQIFRCYYARYDKDYYSRTFTSEQRFFYLALVCRTSVLGNVDDGLHGAIKNFERSGVIISLFVQPRTRVFLDWG